MTSNYSIFPEIVKFFPWSGALLPFFSILIHTVDQLFLRANQHSLSSKKIAQMSAETMTEMERLTDTLNELIDDESIAEYIKEAVEFSETVEDFKSIAVPLIVDLDGVVSSEEDADELAGALYHMKDPPIVKPIEEMNTPIIMSALMQDGVADPFDEDRLAMARLSITEVGHVEALEDNVNTKKYARNLKREEEAIEQIRRQRLESNERENAQFKKGMGFRRPEVRQLRYLQLSPINVNIGPLTLIENASLNLTPGNRYGLVGRNGLGKTTLMKYINSSLVKGVTNDLLIIHVEQEAPISERTVLQSVLDTDVERTELLEELENMENSDAPDLAERITKINDRLDAIGAREAEARAVMILNALGFTNEQLSMPLSLMSGGFRMRVSLAQALYISPDVLLLDEPTGHLDAPSVCWLEEFLTKSCSGQILVVISHDRVFLDNVCTHIVHLKDKKLELYKGNWTSFHNQFEARCQLLEQQAEAQKKEIEHKMDFVRRLGAKSSTAQLAQSRMKAINKIEKVTPIHRDPPVRFDFSMSSTAAQEQLIVIEDASFGYVPEKNIFEHLCFYVKRNTRAVIIGANGAGKSTLLNLLMGNLKPQTGFYQIVSNLRIAHFSQHHVDQLDYKSTPLQFMLKQFKADHPIHEIRAQLGKFGISGEQSLQPIQSLSGGQKTRVVLAACAMQSPHLLMLDEVTNNLDMDSIEALGSALRRYTGAIVAVTHDQAFANMIASQIFVCKDNKMVEFDGSFQEYRDMVKAQIRDKFFASVGSRGII
ncbi:ABC transporter family protein [Tritrichomonas foetus]|uniref:ABC transporter family protein n=1 Tax=Tritrichomonas foetus TaxID=1144522 RepID=A0A1J4K4Q0_9EUKA|nr:ABC transporter family protein [Tritrichomonas foetus]|eukprot:OHT06367.1 ABC transporter family protein [Tritrichomonas foetus]